MSYLRSVLRIMLYLFLIGGSLAIISLIILASWRLASPRDDRVALRLRWHVVTKTEVPKSTRLTEQHLRARLKRLPEDIRFVATTKTAVGKYALRNIEAGAALNSAFLSKFAPADPPIGGAVVPVEVETKHAGSLYPGMRLAFVRKGSMLPLTANLSAGKEQAGFLLVTVTTSSEDAASTILGVEVVGTQIDSVTVLAAGKWRPIVLKSGR